MGGGPGLLNEAVAQPSAQGDCSNPDRNEDRGGRPTYRTILCSHGQCTMFSHDLWWDKLDDQCEPKRHDD